MEILATLIAISSGLAALLKNAYEVHRARSAAQDAAIVSLFTGIANTLDRTAQELREGRTPHGACAEMEKYANEMVPILSMVMDTQEVAHYADLLRQVHHVEKLAVTYAAGELDLSELERVAGTFRAAAVMESAGSVFKR